MVENYTLFVNYDKNKMICKTFLERDIILDIENLNVIWIFIAEPIIYNH
jgi:hypothetical protein